jgi:iron complex outermembrane receptor protein
LRHKPWGAKTFQVRGFDLGSTLLQDCVRLPLYAEIEPATIDHVDVLKGSSSGLYGRIEPGGVINIVTLKPQPVRKTRRDGLDPLPLLTLPP